MADIDPDTLLEWLTMGTGEERDMQSVALEQLCMLLLMSDNVDRCFESCPPRSFLPALCHIFMDETAPDSILEVTARAITYYLDVSAECSRRIVTVEGAVKALCARFLCMDIESRTSRDLAEQCVKVMELMCTREAGAIYEAGGLSCMLTLIREHGTRIHRDTLHSAMSVIARLCAKMEPSDQALEECMVSLSCLLQHEDAYVSDSALKCFACIADRFSRRGVDPAPIAKHGLTDLLLKKLVCSATACSADKSLNASLNSSGVSDSRNNSGNVSIIVSVLSMLCRGSPSFTHDLLRSSLPDAIETAMQGDERCVLDTMRLVDLLLVLLFEGREALPKVPLVTRGSLSGSALRKLDSSGERSHRQLIDCIRSKDTDALIEAIDSSTFDVNFMDDVGQTLLNWAAAFGTIEMVEFLCERGSDVNRGQRSSSLHYAACFGRPQVAKVLLRYGANPELRDEDGKSPLDKARERNDEGHREVVEILQSPTEWMSAAPTADGAAAGVVDMLTDSVENIECAEPATTATETATGTTESVEIVFEGVDASVQCESSEQSGSSAEIESSTDVAVVKGDPEVAPMYVKRLVPVFAATYQSSLVPSIKKATLSTLKKMIHHVPAALLEELVSHAGAAQLAEVVASVLSTEDDYEGHLAAFYCVQDLMSKGSSIFLIHFIRLGVLQRITELAGELDEEDVEEIEADADADADNQIIESKIVNEKARISEESAEDATKLQLNRPYHWRDWCVVRGRDCLYLWNEYCAVELSNGSNGWFRFVLDGKLATMYSSGSPEGGSSSSESRSEFLDKLQRAKQLVPSTSVSQPVLSRVAETIITVGNWTLRCKEANHLTIINTDGQQTTTLREDLAGFLFESNRGTRHTFTAETALGADFPAASLPWAKAHGQHGSKKIQSKRDQIRQKLAALAKCIYCKYFKDADLSPHGSMARLNKISTDLHNASKLSLGTDTADSTEDIISQCQEIMTIALTELCCLLQEESMLSSYEIHRSGLVNALNNCLNKAHPHLLHSPRSVNSGGGVEDVFKQVFGAASKLADELMSKPPSVCLVQKLIAVLESSEKLPVFAYEGIAGGTGLQVLLRRLRFKLERDGSSGNLIDRSGHFLKMEPLTSVRDVEQFLVRMVAKQWYDYERNSLAFISHFKQRKNGRNSIAFAHETDFDENGILYWIGTNAGTALEWVNPAHHSLVSLNSSEGKSLPYGRLEDILSRDSAPVNCHTNDDVSSWFSIDLGLYVLPTAYTIRHARGYGRSAMRNWLFEASRDVGETWTTLRAHENDDALTDPGSTSTWTINGLSANDKKGWHLFRIKQNGANASEQTHYLSVSGFEIYGTVTGCTDELTGQLVPSGEGESAAEKRQRRVFRSQILRHMALGAKDGTDWKTLQEEAQAKVMANENRLNASGGGAYGKADSWVDVSWAQNLAAVTGAPKSSGTASKTGSGSGGTATSGSGGSGGFNVKVVDISDPDVQASMQEVEQRGSRGDSSRLLRQTTLDNALRQVVLSFGKKESNKTPGGDESTLAPEKQVLSSTPQRGGEGKLSLVSQGVTSMGDCNDQDTAANHQATSHLDLANLQFLMAVEDLLDSSSSDLVANALAEAASVHVDQLRSATRNFRSSLLENTGANLGPPPSAQSSRESRSPPTELMTPPPTETTTPAETTGNTTPTTNQSWASELVAELTNQEAAGQVAEAAMLPEFADVKHVETDSTGEDPVSTICAGTATDEAGISQQECFDQIQQIASSMSQVLERMQMVSGTGTGDDEDPIDEFDDYGGHGEDDYEQSATTQMIVEENNFLNGNPHMMEPTMISLLHDDEDDEDDDDSEDDDDDDNDDDDDETEDEQIEMCDERIAPLSEAGDVDCGDGEADTIKKRNAETTSSDDPATIGDSSMAERVNAELLMPIEVVPCSTMPIQTAFTVNTVEDDSETTGPPSLMSDSSFDSEHGDLIEEIAEPVIENGSETIETTSDAIVEEPTDQDAVQDFVQIYSTPDDTESQSVDNTHEVRQDGGGVSGEDFIQIMRTSSSTALAEDSEVGRGESSAMEDSAIIINQMIGLRAAENRQVVSDLLMLSDEFHEISVEEGGTIEMNDHPDIHEPINEQVLSVSVAALEPETVTMTAATEESVVCSEGNLLLEEEDEDARDAANDTFEEVGDDIEPLTDDIEASSEAFDEMNEVNEADVGVSVDAPSELEHSAAVIVEDPTTTATDVADTMVDSVGETWASIVNAIDEHHLSSDSEHSLRGGDSATEENLHVAETADAVIVDLVTRSVSAEDPEPPITSSAAPLPFTAQQFEDENMAALMEEARAMSGGSDAILERIRASMRTDPSSSSYAPAMELNPEMEEFKLAAYAEQLAMANASLERQHNRLVANGIKNGDVESMDEMDMEDAEDDEEDEDFDDIENEDENEAEEMYEPLQRKHAMRGGRPGDVGHDSNRHVWDDELVLKRQHASLVPAFDPRPGRTNVQQTQDIEIPTTSAAAESSRQDSVLSRSTQQQRVQLFLRGSPAPGAPEIEIPMENRDATLFSYAQTLALHGSNGENRADKLRRVWEPSYTLVYRSEPVKSTDEDYAIECEDKDERLKWSVPFVKQNLGQPVLPKSDLINHLKENASEDFLRHWKLQSSTKTCRKQRNCSVLISAYEEFARQQTTDVTEDVSDPTEISEPLSVDLSPVHSSALIHPRDSPIEDSLGDLTVIEPVLDVIKALHDLTEDGSAGGSHVEGLNVATEEFLSKKLTNKLQQQIQDPLVLTSGSLPLWCEYLVINFPMLFPFETRQMFFKATAFGCSRSIVWLQTMHDQALERSRSHPPSSARRAETHEFRIGRLKHERVTVPRGEKLLETAMLLMDFHAEKKSVLEIEFLDEEGTGLGPSLEFYSLLALEVQRNDLHMWVSNDVIREESPMGEEDGAPEQPDLTRYSRHTNGLFPAPMPQRGAAIEALCERFRFLGILIAKCLQDGRLVDIPLSNPFFKLLCAGKGKNAFLHRTISHSAESSTATSTTITPRGADTTPRGELPSCLLSIVSRSVEKMDAHYFSEVMHDHDWSVVHPDKHAFISRLRKFTAQRAAILSDRALSEDERSEKLATLLFDAGTAHECKLIDLGLTFQYIPSSSVFGYDAVDLKPNGANIELCDENAEEYIELLFDFCMHYGIAKQLESLRAGFNRVFPMEKLHGFTPAEVRLMLCGEQTPQWSHDELMAYAEPKIGYTKESPGFLRLVNVLVRMNGEERKAFLQFTTGCSSLPPGGIANLHPRLTVVKKDADGDGSFPSVNTCAHYLKLPEYSSEEILYEKLIAATNEKGFHLN